MDSGHGVGVRAGNSEQLGQRIRVLNMRERVGLVNPEEHANARRAETAQEIHVGLMVPGGARHGLPEQIVSGNEPSEHPEPEDEKDRRDDEETGDGARPFVPWRPEEPGPYGALHLDVARHAVILIETAAPSNMKCSQEMAR